LLEYLRAKILSRFFSFRLFDSRRLGDSFPFELLNGSRKHHFG
jgi:hypothetical protein